MKRLLLSLTALVSFVGCALAQANSTAKPQEQGVLKLEQQWEDALTHSDTVALEQLYDDTLVYTHSSGKVDTKASYIRTIKSGATKYESMTRDDIKVNVYQNCAVVTCHWDVHISSQGNKVSLNARYTHVYVQQPDGWKLVAHESTRVSP
jgi:ketosteroid isomerase-like protein